MLSQHLTNNSKVNSPIIFFGLGNPGPGFEVNRHNTGKLLQGFLLTKIKANFDNSSNKQQGTSWLSQQFGNLRFLNSTKFMNQSGEALVSYLDYKKITDFQLVILFDDLDLKFAEFKIKKGKFPKAHNGVNSVINSLSRYFIKNNLDNRTDDIVSCRIGVDNRPGNYQGSGEEYLLANFSKEEQGKLAEQVFPEVTQELFSVLNLDSNLII